MMSNRQVIPHWAASYINHSEDIWEKASKSYSYLQNTGAVTQITWDVGQRKMVQKDGTGPARPIVFAGGMSNEQRPGHKDFHKTAAGQAVRTDHRCPITATSLLVSQHNLAALHATLAFGFTMLSLYIDLFCGASD
eukprot:scaffold6177_cov44-Prasinocladus_malaysianus.AAC.2